MGSLFFSITYGSINFSFKKLLFAHLSNSEVGTFKFFDGITRHNAIFNLAKSIYKFTESV